jgi:hypothetical protein
MVVKRKGYAIGERRKFRYTHVRNIILMELLLLTYKEE